MSGLKYPILVVGTGPAGMSAAVAAAQRDKCVLLMERNGITGGSVTACLINTLCGLYYRNNTEACWCSEGFVRQWAQRLAEQSNSYPVKMPGGVWTLPFNPEVFRTLFDDSIRKHRNIDLLLHATACRAQTEGRKITHVLSMSGDRIIDIQPEVVIDCTGQAGVVQLAGGETVDITQSQAAAVIIRLGDVNHEIHTRTNLLALLREIGRAVKTGVLPGDCQKISFTPSADPNELYLKLAISADHMPQDTNRMEEQAGKLTAILIKWISEDSHLLKNCQWISTASQVGIRASRYGVGKAVLTRENVLRCDRSDDAVASCAWPIEVWNDSGHCVTEFVPENQRYDIPAGCLMSKDFDNLLMAGRCISAHAEAMASVRVIACCMATGYSAGRMAAEMTTKG